MTNLVQKILDEADKEATRLANHSLGMWQSQCETEDDFDKLAQSVLNPVKNPQRLARHIGRKQKVQHQSKDRSYAA